MKFTQVFATLLVSPLAALAAECTAGKIYCGNALIETGDYTEAQLADLIKAQVGDNTVPGVDVALFICSEETNKIDYEGSYCLCECVGSDDPNKICSECPAL